MNDRRYRLNRNSFIHGCLAAFFIALIFSVSFSYAESADTGLPDGFIADEELNRDLNLNKYGVPVHQYKDVFEEEMVTVPAIDVYIEEDDDLYPAEDGVLFRIYNATTQKTEQIVPTVDGKLTDLELRRGHAYMITAAEDQYIISNYTQYGVASRLYVWALKKGDQGVAADGAYDYKTGYLVNDAGEVEGDYLSSLNEIDIHYSSEGYYDPLRYTMKMPVMSGNKSVDGVKFVFTSPEDEPITAVSTGGIVQAELIEDADYTVHVEDENYDIENFSVTVKDKSEHKFADELTGKIRTYGRYCYDHTCCQGADAFNLISKTAASETRKGSVNSVKTYKDAGGKQKPITVVSGMNFKTMLLLVRNKGFDVPDGFRGSDCEIVDYTLVNPHRWEICRITDIDMHVRQHLSRQGRKVRNVFLLDNGSAVSLAFTQPSSGEVEFDIKGMPSAPVLIEYGEAWQESSSSSVKTDNVSDKTAPAEIVDLPAIKIAKPKAAKKSVSVKWKKISKKNQKKIAKVQVQYSTDKSFVSADTKTIFAKKNKTLLKIKKLKSRKTYYVHVRAYKSVNGKIHVSKWSKTKTVRVK